MISYSPNRINENFAYFGDCKNTSNNKEDMSNSEVRVAMAGIFLGQKVILATDQKRINGVVILADINQVIVQILGGMRGVGLHNLKCYFLDATLEFPLSPTLFGRQLDVFGNPLDGLSSVLSICSFDELPEPTGTLSSDYIIPKILPKGTFSKINQADLLGIFEKLENPNLVLILCYLDPHSVANESISKQIQKHKLDKITLTIHPENSQQHCNQTSNSLLFLPTAIDQASKYFAIELGFDVLVVVVNSEKLSQKSVDQNTLGNIAKNYPKGSVSVILV